MVQINGKMLIASSSTMVGLMNNHAIARSDIPARLVVKPGLAAATGTAVASLISIVVCTSNFLYHDPAALALDHRSPLSALTHPGVGPQYALACPSALRSRRPACKG